MLLYYIIKLVAAQRIPQEASQIIVELERFGAKQIDLPSLADAIPGAEYGKLSHGYKVVKCSVESLTAYFDGASSDE